MSPISMSVSFHALCLTTDSALGRSEALSLNKTHSFIISLFLPWLGRIFKGLILSNESSEKLFYFVTGTHAHAAILDTWQTQAVDLKGLPTWGSRRDVDCLSNRYKKLIQFLVLCHHCSQRGGPPHPPWDCILPPSLILHKSLGLALLEDSLMRHTRGHDLMVF